PGHHTYQNTRLGGNVEGRLRGNQHIGAAGERNEWKGSQARAAIVLIPLPAGGQPERERNQKLPGVRRQVRSNQGGKTHVWYSDVLVMKITSVRSFLLSYPLESPLKLEFHGGERTILKRDAMLIRIGTDKGLVGYAPGPR